jgi:hypothetical protein
VDAHPTPPWNRVLSVAVTSGRGSSCTRALFRALPRSAICLPSPPPTGGPLASHLRTSWPPSGSAGSSSAPARQSISYRSMRKRQIWGKKIFLVCPPLWPGSCKPAAGSLPRRATTILERCRSAPRRIRSAPERSSSDPRRNRTAPEQSSSAPRRNGSDPEQSSSAPQRNGS